MDDQTRSIIRNVKGPGMPLHSHDSIFIKELDAVRLSLPTRTRMLTYGTAIVREDDILCLLESEREARRLR